jgi:hypothetical protein
MLPKTLMRFLRIGCREPDRAVMRCRSNQGAAIEQEIGLRTAKLIYRFFLKVRLQR